MAKGYAGYTFPNLPGGWKTEERTFGLALRSLFDTIFSDQQTQDRNTEANGERITETNTKFDKKVSTINEKIKEIDSQMDEDEALLEDTIDRLDNTVERVEDLEGRMEAVDGEEGRLAGIDDRLDDQEDRLDAIDGEDGRLDTIDGRLDDIDGTGGRLDGIDGRLDDIDGTGGLIEGLDSRVSSLETAIGEAYIEIYPIGIVVFTTSATPPFQFGTWESELTDPNTGDPAPDSDGHYRWERIVDAS